MLFLLVTGQGLAHGALRIQLERLTRSAPDYEARKSIILFRFIYEDTGRDEVPARITVTNDSGISEDTEDRGVVGLKKRSTGTTSKWTGPGLSAEELRAYVRAGKAYETLIHENSTVSHTEDARTMTGYQFSLLPTTGLVCSRDANTADADYSTRGGA